MGARGGVKGLSFVGSGRGGLLALRLHPFSWESEPPPLPRLAMMPPSSPITASSRLCAPPHLADLRATLLP